MDKWKFPILLNSQISNRRELFPLEYFINCIFCLFRSKQSRPLESITHITREVVQLLAKPVAIATDFIGIS